MAFADKLGSQYTAVKDKINLRTVHIKTDETEFNLKVRIPLKQEFELINESIVATDEVKVEALYQKLSQSVKKTLDDGGEEFLKTINKDKDFIIVKDNDIIIDGNSIRNAAVLSIMMESKVEQYFHLLVSETGEPITESYEEIAKEFPEDVIKQIVNEIEKIIKPDYSSVKKKLRKSLRRQVTAAMVFNGHTEQYINSLDEDLFAEIQVMYAEGMLGNKAIYNALTPITTALYNYMRGPNQRAYKSNEIFPWIDDYLKNPDIEDNQVSNSLLLFMTQAPNFKIDRFQKNGS